jgi:hypothetical protein
VGEVLLTYDSMRVGEVFPPVVFEVSEALVAEYEAVTGDPWTPPALAGVWARLGYQQGRELPPGGVMAGLTVEHLRDYPPGTVLVLHTTVTEKGERRKVVLVTEAADGEGVVGRVTIDARWGT